MYIPGQKTAETMSSTLEPAPKFGSIPERCIGCRARDHGDAVDDGAHGRAQGASCAVARDLGHMGLGVKHDGLRNSRRWLSMIRSKLMFFPNILGGWGLFIPIM